MNGGNRTAAGVLAWPALAVLIALPALLPLLSIAAAYLRPDPGLWAHLREYVLPQVVPTTLQLLALVVVAVSLLGAALGALVALCEFPGRAFFAWALLLPMAIPGYVLATVAVAALDYSGALPGWLRAHGITVPEIRNVYGVAAVLSLTLYPYVYLVARAAFAAQGVRALEAARVLGYAPLAAFLRVALPLAAPAIAAGAALAAMETLADFGTVAAFNVDTFTAAIYKAWFALFSIDSALQLCGVLLLFVALLLAAERRARGARRYTHSGAAVPRLRLRGARAGLAFLACALVWTLAFALPVAHLLVWALREIATQWDAAAYLRLAANAVLLASMAALLTAAAALLLLYAQRERPQALTRAAARLASAGYAFPGALLAVGLFVPLTAATRELAQQLGFAPVLQGSLLVMLMAYGVRFLAVAAAPLSASLLRITPHLDEAVRLAGVQGLARLRLLHLPLLRGGLLSALALVFVDVMKEMPITLMTRPFGWDTLATRVFELTSEGQWRQAALPALGIVAAGLLPVVLLVRQLDRAGASGSGAGRAAAA